MADLGPNHNNRKGFKPKMRGTSSRSMDFERLIEKGENPLGFTSQTVNGSAHYEGTGWNKMRPMSAPEVEPGGAWKGGRYSNRTGE